MSLDQPPGESGSIDLLRSDKTGATAIPRRSLWGLIAISLFWLALNFHWTAFLIIILPSQVEALLAHSYLQSHAFNQGALNDFVNNNKAVALALVSSPGLLVALVSNPLFGMLSDRTAGRWGRRRPYILGGTLLNMVGLALMLAAPNIITLMLALCLTQLANNAAAAPFHAFLPDLVNEEQRGLAAGIMGFVQTLGFIAGALVIGQLIQIDPVLKAQSADTFNSALSTYNGQLLAAYSVVGLVIFVLMLLTIVTVKEQPWQRRIRDAAPGNTESGIGWFAHYRQQVGEGTLALALVIIVLIGALLALQATGLSFDLNGAHPPQGSSAQAASDAAQHANIAINAVLLVVMLIVALWAARLFDFRPRRDPDFAWVVGTRLLMMLGINTVQAFLQYYFHDILGSQNQEAQAGEFVIAVTLAGALTTFFGGWLSTRYGRKRMVYLSGGLMTAVAAIFIALNFLVTGGTLSADAGITIALVGGAIFGLGYGAYLSVDWALVADVLPSKDRFARDMGVWNIALTMPQVIAFVIGSVLLSLAVAPAYRYTFLFITFIAYCLAGTITVRYIKGVKR
ncbi:MAG TPA: MFS transporter [Ktedonobacterales bacterium]|jgi:MFS family permease